MVNIINWNPKKKAFRTKPLKYLPIYKAVNNFGDLIGPLIVEKLLGRLDIINLKKNRNKRRLLTVGSILHFALDGDTVWGSGVNGKISEKLYRFRDLDVRAVRGPLTREFLLQKSIHCPEIFGDPGLLLPDFFPEYEELAKNKCFDLTIVPNFNDFDDFKGTDKVINPTSPFHHVVERICRSEFVVGSSLHGIVIAEAFGIPARLLPSKHESDFKYEDYYLGTGRGSYCVAKTISQAIELGGEKPLDKRLISSSLVQCFPKDLWTV